jgi:TRAP-type C4-dicarboxylate transport system substrate-binding protein
VSAGGFQIFGVAKNMMNFNVAPFMGGIIMTRKAWQSIPDEYKPKLLESIKRIEKDIDSAITNLETTAVNTMIDYGLRVNEITPDQEADWIGDIDKTIPALLNTKNFDRDLYNKINALVKDRRK